MKDELIVNCSPVYMNKGKHHVIVHITRRSKHTAGYDRADVILPERQVIGYYGFKENESEMLFDYIRKHDESIWDLGYDMSEKYFAELEQMEPAVAAE